MKIQFTKMTAAGNDFVLVDDRRSRLNRLPQIARRLCDRRFGIGADGLLVVRVSSRSAYRMLYYNSDGSSGGMCGNGGRCIAVYAVKRRIAERSHTFEAFRYLYSVTVGKQSAVLKMKDITSISVKKIRANGKSNLYYKLDTGAPHIVIPFEGTAKQFRTLDVVKEARPLRFHSTFGPYGVNVNFIRKIRPGVIEMRTYERGVEGETLACGTGSVASAAVSVQHYDFTNNVQVQTRSGKTFKVSLKRHEKGYSGVRLTGPVEFVFEGTTEL